MDRSNRSCARQALLALSLTWGSWAQAAPADLRMGPPLPLGAGSGVWIENQGQWPEEVRYLGQIQGRVIRLECGAIGIQTLDATSSRGSYARIVFDEPNASATPTGSGAVDATFSFFLGANPASWRPAVHGFTQVVYASITEGIGLALRGEGDRLVYDLIRSSNATTIDPLVRLDDPVGYRSGASSSIPLSAAWVLALGPTANSSTGAMAVHSPPTAKSGSALHSPPPSLLWSTYLGSSDSQGHGDYAEAAAWNDAGEVAVSGIADLLGFPQTPGAYQELTGSRGLVFLTKLRGRDGALVYSALLGGTFGGGGPHVHDVALDRSGKATVVGQTRENTFPTTPGAFDPVKTDPNSDAGFVTQFTASGDALVYSTFLESEGASARVDAVAVHDGGGIVIAGGAGPGVFPTTPGAFQTSFRGQTADAFVGRLNASGSAFHWLTLLGGTRWQAARDVALTHDGRPVVLCWTGSFDFPVTPGAFQSTLGNWVQRATAVTVFDPSASVLSWSTFVAGNSPGEFDEPRDVSLDGDGCVFVAGDTNSPTFPVTPGAFQTVFPPPNGSNVVTGYVLRLDPTGSALHYSTLITGTLSGGAANIHVDPSGVATLSGGGFYSFPTTPGAYDSTPLVAPDPSFFRLAPGGDRLFYFTHVGGPGSDAGRIATNSRGRVTLAGYSTGGYPTTPNAVQPNYAGGQTDAIVTTLDLVLHGVRPFGESTTSCRGVLQMNTTEMPAAGAAGFGIWCSGAPPSTTGLLVFGAPLSVPASIGGAQLWVDPSQPNTRIAVESDSHGFVETTIPLPVGSTGRTAAAQYLFRNPPTCGTGRSACSSNALLIEVQ